MRIIVFKMLMLMLVLPATSWAASTLTMTTYYPPPSGNFEELRLNPVTKTNAGCTLTDTGALLVDVADKTMYLCDSGNWTTIGGGNVWVQNVDFITLNNDTALLKVGINTSTPQQDLDVNGNVLFEGVNNRLYFNDGIHYIINDGTGMTIYQNDNTQDILFNNNSTGGILFDTANLERMRVTSSGNVSIGGNYDNAKFTVLTATYNFPAIGLMTVYNPNCANGLVAWSLNKVESGCTDYNFMSSGVTNYKDLIINRPANGYVRFTMGGATDQMVINPSNGTTMYNVLNVPGSVAKPFRIQDGNQFPGKVWTATDAAGNGQWQTHYANYI